uniref:Uncharacterized protein n=1 Tax=Oryza glumipatula TaxID=40148 RepID=A0A0D9ZZU7_9ORYZ
MTDESGLNQATFGINSSELIVKEGYTLPNGREYISVMATTAARSASSAPAGGDVMHLAMCRPLCHARNLKPDTS